MPKTIRGMPPLRVEISNAFDGEKATWRVIAVPPAVLRQRAREAGIKKRGTIYGLCDWGAKQILLRDTLTKAHALAVLQHETEHAVFGSIVSEYAVEVLHDAVSTVSETFIGWAEGVPQGAQG